MTGATARDTSLHPIPGSTEAQKTGANAGRSATRNLYEGRIDLSVGNNSHTIAFEMIQEHGGGRRSRILEVGCSSGYFGESLRRVGHEVWGIEPNPVAAEVAAQRLDRVFAGNLQEFADSPSGRETRFDFITFGDVLEHFPSPEHALEQAVVALRPGGAIVASVPNVTHSAVRLMLLEGRWDYDDLGILDRTHLRFFSRRGLLQLFSAAGLKVQMLDCVRLPVEQTGIRIDRTLQQRAMPLIGDDDQDVFQFVLLATPAPPEEARRWNERYLVGAYRRVLCLPPIAEWSVGDIRLRNPLTWWARFHGGCVRIKQIHTVQPGDLDWADFVVLQRESDEFTLGLIDTCQQMGKRVIFDMDDLLTEVPPFLSVHAHTVKAKPLIEGALAKADAVTVTTHRLRDRLAAISRRVFVVPNCASNIEGLRASHDDSQQTLHLIVASSDTVRVDFLLPVLQRLISNPAPQFSVIGIGPPGKFLSDAGLTVNMHPLMTHREFKRFVAGIRNAIALIPLDDSEFSSCKSAVKYLDYALAGIPCVCSAVPPYTDIVRNGESGHLAENTLDGWYNAILDLAASAERRRQVAGSAERDCRRDFSMNRAALEWQAVFSALPAPAKPAGIHLSQFPVPPRLARMKAFGRMLLSPSVLGKGLRVIRREGWRGFRDRLRRHLLP